MKKLESIPPLPHADDLHVWLSILEAEQKKKQNVLAKMPAGHLELSKSHGSQQVYYVNGKTRRYLSAKEQPLLAAMAQKRCLKYELVSLNETIGIVKQLFDNQEHRSVRSAFLKLPEILRRQTEPSTLSDEEYASNWQNVTWEHKPVSDEFPYYTERGEHVRSKSEIIIANALFHAHIPYRYEYPLKLGDVTLHPDFLCLNVAARREFYWEHLGMMDNTDYHEKALNRLEKYIQAGIFPFDKLLLTSETENQHLDTRRVVQIIARFLK